MSDDDSTKRREQIKLAADAPDDTWFRVKDKDTGHEYSIGKSAYDVNAHEILLDSEGNLRPGRAVDGTVLPAKPRVNLKPAEQISDSADGADAGDQGPADAASSAASGAGATGAADSTSGEQSAAPTEKEKTR